MSDFLVSDPRLRELAFGKHPWGDVLAETDNQTIVLNSRKSIWTNFPVNVLPLGCDDDGAECHAVAWRPNTGKKALCLPRLLTALYKSDKWTVEPAPKTDYICILRMVFDPQNAKQHSSAPNLMRLNDIYTHFPAVFTKIDAVDKMYAIELHKKRVQKMSELRGYDMTQEMRNTIYNALKASTQWRVADATSATFICYILLN